MENVREIVGGLMSRLVKLAREGAVVSQPIAVDDRYVVPLCELGIGYGGGGGGGGAEESRSRSKPGRSSVFMTGDGLGGGGGAAVRPLAVLVIDGDDVRMESLNE